MLSLRDVHVHIGKLHILQGVSLEVKEGRVRRPARPQRRREDDNAALHHGSGGAQPRRH